MDEALVKMLGFAHTNDASRLLSAEERDALWYAQTEAAELGSKLRTGGRGGLPPSFVLHVFRRDKYVCKKCGQPGSDDNGGLTVHHKAGARNLVGELVQSRAKRNKNHPHNLAVVCHSCHDATHDEDREEGREDER